MNDAPGSANLNEHGATGPQRLRVERERRGLERQQVADDLHVDVRIIEALEAGRFERLGAPVFVRGHLRKYAELLGLDPEPLLSAYGQQSVQPPELVPIIPATHSRPEMPAKLIGVLVIAVIVFGAAWWALRKRDTSPPVSAPVTESAESPAAVAEDESAAVAPAAQPAAATETIAVPASAPVEARQNEIVAERASTGTPVRLRLSFSADSWVELYDADGRRFYFDLGPANSVRSFSATAPVRVFLGNADGVQLELNGQAVALPDQVKRGNVARFTVDARGQVRPADD